MSGTRVETTEPGFEIPETEAETTAPRDPSGEMTLNRIIAPVRQPVYIGMGMSAVGGLAWLTALYLISLAVRELMGRPPDTDGLWRLAALVLLAVVAAFALRILSFKWSHIGAFALEEILRTRLTNHLAKVPLGYVVTTGAGALKKVLMDDVRSLHAYVGDSTPMIARGFTTPVFALVIMFAVDWRMSLVSLAVFPVGLLAMRLAFTDWETERKAYDAGNERINRVIIEYVQGMQVVRTFDDGTESFKRYREALTEATKTTRAWADRSRRPVFVARVLFAALPTLAVVTPAGIWMMERGLIDMPTFVLFLFFGPTVSESIIPLIWLSHLINTASAGARRIGRLLAEPILSEPAVSRPPRHAGVRLDKVTFRYADREEAALCDVSIDIPEGRMTALVGPSGAGKSTVARLIPRFWDVTKGTVLVGGVDVRRMSSDDLMKQVSFVFQDPFLLFDSVRENIRLGRPDATDEEVMEAAKAAQAHEFIINELPDGYETRAGDRGTRLSGGQRQRITIARAILQNAPIVVMDEATAFADPENEARIHAAISRLTVGKTLIVVAHRLSTIRDADQIVVLDKGRVVETGNHGELMAAKGVYAKLWSGFEQARVWGLRRSGRADATTKITDAAGEGRCCSPRSSA